MTRFWFILLLLVAPLRAVNAQTQTISVSGQARCGTEKVVGALVTMLQPTDSSIVAYTTTDKQGFYTLKATTQLSEVLLSISGFNIKRKTTRIKAHSQTLDFYVEEENRILREVVVKSQKLWGNRDTLNYLVSAYTRGKDRSIGDVLQKLPGITIEDNGVIKYQGTPINHFYIENLDMLQGRYNLATQGIKAEDVATVQVLENHEHIRSRQDQTPSEHAAINLKLKDKAKGIWSKSASLGAGHNLDETLWEAMLQTMYFGKGKQHMLRYSGDNLGRSLEMGTDHYGFSSEGNSRMVSLVEHSSPPIGNSLCGYRHSINLNNLTKLSDSTTINYNFNYSHNFTSGHSFSQTTYFLPICYGRSSCLGYIALSTVKNNSEWINRWKVFMPYANNIRTELYDDNLNAFVGQPNSVATETFLVVGADLSLDENSAQALVQYLKTRFARFMHSLSKASQHATSKTYRFVPLQDFTVQPDIDWNKSISEIDQQLYKKYELSEDEIAFIERKIKPMK